MKNSILFVIAVLLSTTINCTYLNGLTKTQSKSKQISNEERTQYCDNIAKRFGFESLKFSSHDTEDIEIRVWVSGGLVRDRGVILKSKAGNWSAYHLSADASDSNNVKSVTEPKIGFAMLIERLENIGIFIKQYDSFSDMESLMDGQLVTIEVFKNNKYETYSYLEPSISDSIIAKKISKILEVIETNLDVKLYAQPDKSLIFLVSENYHE